jgi:hypothetical protein
LTKPLKVLKVGLMVGELTGVQEGSCNEPFAVLAQDPLLEAAKVELNFFRERRSQGSF